MGWIPSAGYQTTCFAFFWEDELIVLDAGTGFGRLLDLRSTLFRDNWRRLARARIFLSHYHLDHISGLFWLRGVFHDLPLTVFAPGSDFYGCHAHELLDRVFCKPFSPRKLREFGPGVAIEDLGPGGLTLQSGSVPLRVGVRLNPNHADPSVSLRFGDLFAFVTDTPPEDEVVDFVRGVRVLLHESWDDSSDVFESEDDPLARHTIGPHAGSFGAGLVAKRAGIDRLYLIHHNPERTIEDAESDAVKVTRELGIDCKAAKDLDPIVL